MASTREDGQAPSREDGQAPSLYEALVGFAQQQRARLSAGADLSELMVPIRLTLPFTELEVTAAAQVAGAQGNAAAVAETDPCERMLRLVERGLAGLAATLFDWGRRPIASFPGELLAARGCDGGLSWRLLAEQVEASKQASAFEGVTGDGVSFTQHANVRAVPRFWGNYVEASG